MLWPISHGYAEDTAKISAMDSLAGWVIAQHRKVLPLAVLLTVGCGYLMLLKPR